MLLSKSPVRSISEKLKSPQASIKDMKIERKKDFRSFLKYIERESKELEKIILCDEQNIIYPDLEKAFLNLLHDSGYKTVKITKKVDFEDLYKKKFN